MCTSVGEEAGVRREEEKGVTGKSGKLNRDSNYVKKNNNVLDTKKEVQSYIIQSFRRRV